MLQFMVMLFKNLLCASQALREREASKRFFCVNSCSTQTSSFFLNPIFCKWFQTVLWSVPSSWPIERMLTYRSTSMISTILSVSTTFLRHPLHQNEIDRPDAVLCESLQYRAHKLNKIFRPPSLHFYLSGSKNVKYDEL